jgi:hypothetical protein
MLTSLIIYIIYFSRSQYLKYLFVHKHVAYFYLFTQIALLEG